MSIDQSVILRRNEEFIHSAIDNETVMMSIEQGEYYGLDEIATRIWNILEVPHSLTEIVDILAPDYDVDRIQIEADVAQFLEEMLAGKILLKD